MLCSEKNTMSGGQEATAFKGRQKEANKQTPLQGWNTVYESPSADPD